MKRRQFIQKVSEGITALPFTTPSLSSFFQLGYSKRGLLNAYYFRAHSYTMVPHQVKEDLKWMKAIGTDIVSIAILEQDFFAAVENIDIIFNEASKLNMQVYAVPSRWQVWWQVPLRCQVFFRYSIPILGCFEKMGVHIHQSILE